MQAWSTTGSPANGRDPQKNARVGHRTQLLEGHLGPYAKRRSLNHWKTKKETLSCASPALFLEVYQLPDSLPDSHLKTAATPIELLSNQGVRTSYTGHRRHFQPRKTHLGIPCCLAPDISLPTFQMRPIVDALGSWFLSWARCKPGAVVSPREQMFEV